MRRLDEKIFGHLRDEYYHLLARELSVAGASILDVGCGSASPIAGVGTDRGFSVGVDGHLASLLASSAAQLHDAYVAADIRLLEDVFKPRSFDAVIALDVIEHLEKPDGYLLLRQMERVARTKVIVFTPSGFLPQSPYDDNPFQEHLSGWTAAEMRREGFEVRGVNGWKSLRTERAACAFRPHTLTARISWLSQPLVRWRPEHAFQLFCVKRNA